MFKKFSFVCLSITIFFGFAQASAIGFVGVIDGKVVCSEGYTYNKATDHCEEIYVPPNASLSGTSWVCEDDRLKAGGLCHESKAFYEDDLDVVNIYEIGRELTPELKAIIMSVMPDMIVDHFASYVDIHLKGLKPGELLNINVSSDGLIGALKYLPVQLDLSPIPEIFVIQHSSLYCGASGCGGFILDLDTDGGPKKIGDVFFSGTLVKPQIGPAPAPKSGYYDFVIVSDEGMNVYHFDSLKGHY